MTNGVVDANARGARLRMLYMLDRAVFVRRHGWHPSGGHTEQRWALVKSRSTFRSAQKGFTTIVGFESPKYD
jgi:hypothetical protein